MPKKGVKERKWNASNMEKAVLSVRNGEMGLLLASKTYQVPRTTLQRLARSEKSVAEIFSIKLGRKPVFDEKIEQELVEYLLEMEGRYFGYTRSDIRSLAFQLAKKNNISNPFSVLRKTAGKDWLYGFLKRHKDVLSLRTATGTSVNRAMGFTKENIQKFFNLLDEMYNKYQFQPGRIYNVDETGLSVVQSKHPQVIAKRGKRQIGILTSAERGSLVTVITCMSASGNFVPPFFIFPRKNQHPALMKHAPAGAKAAYHLSGWIQLHIFTEWFHHFLEHSKPSEDDPVLLILDGHYSHTRNIEVIELARKHHVTIISLPPHSTHKLQPLDKSFMGPLKTYYNEEIRVHLRETGRKVTQFDISQLFTKAYLKVQNGEIAVNGFKCTGICPFNRNVFNDSEFLAVDGKDGEKSGDAGETSNNHGSSSMDQAQDCTVVFSPWDLSPPPAIKKVNSNRGRKSRPTVLTSSPYKNELEHSISKISEKKNKKARKCSKTGNEENNVQKKQKKNSEKSKKQVPINNKKQVKIRGNQRLDSSTSNSTCSMTFAESEDENEIDIPPLKTETCIFCKIKWEDDVLPKIWTSCIQCNLLWAHQDCVPRNQGFFLCDSCNSMFNSSL